MIDEHGAMMATDVYNCSCTSFRERLRWAVLEVDKERQGQLNKRIKSSIVTSVLKLKIYINYGTCLSWIHSYG
jgi:hypothetical protein